MPRYKTMNCPTLVTRHGVKMYFDPEKGHYCDMPATNAEQYVNAGNRRRLVVDLWQAGKPVCSLDNVWWKPFTTKDGAQVRQVWVRFNSKTSTWDNGSVPRYSKPAGKIWKGLGVTRLCFNPKTNTHQADDDQPDAVWDEVAKKYIPNDRRRLGWKPSHDISR